MKCPHCGHEKNRITDTERRPDFDLRYRICMGCAKRFTTMDRVAVYAGRQFGHVEVQQQMPAAPAKKNKSSERFVATLDEDRLINVCAEAQPLLVQWWNESRWSKHKGKATWTETAWEISVERVAALAKPQQIELAKAGVENGWQTLKCQYLNAASSIQPPTATGRPMPKDPAMLAALDSWPGTV